MEYKPGWIHYGIYAGDQPVSGVIPGKEELEIPGMYQDELLSLVKQLGLDKATPVQAVEIVKDFFSSNFSYSLTQRQRYPRGKYLSKFLFENRQGHCEYFATATALLLRAAGIPARYSVGYSVQEYSNLEKRYIARASDAHSWVEAYINDGWLVVDTTPSVWVDIDEKDVPVIRPIIDFWSWISYLLISDDIDEQSSGKNMIMVWILLPILFLYIWRMFSGKRYSRKNQQVNEPEISIKQGMDSVFYRLYQVLESKYGERPVGMTLTRWIGSLSRHNIADGSKLERIIRAHYRYRFDPDGLSKEELKMLDQEVDSMIAGINP